MAAKVIELLASGARTASATGASVNIPTLTMGILTVDITAKSGTAPTLDVTLQGTDDNGTTWYDIPIDLVLKSAVGATVSTNQRKIAAVEADMPGKFVGAFKHLPFTDVRLNYEIGGTTPSITFRAKLAAK